MTSWHTPSTKCAYVRRLLAASAVPRRILISAVLQRRSDAPLRGFVSRVLAASVRLSCEVRISLDRLLALNVVQVAPTQAPLSPRMPVERSVHRTKIERFRQLLDQAEDIDGRQAILRQVVAGEETRETPRSSHVRTPRAGDFDRPLILHRVAVGRYCMRAGSP